MRLFNKFFYWYSTLDEESFLALVLFVPCVILVLAIGLTVGFD